MDEGGAMKGKWWEELIGAWCQGVVAVAELVSRRAER